MSSANRESFTSFHSGYLLFLFLLWLLWLKLLKLCWIVVVRVGTPVLFLSLEEIHFLTIFHQRFSHGSHILAGFCWSCDRLNLLTIYWVVGECFSAPCSELGHDESSSHRIQINLWIYAVEQGWDTLLTIFYWEWKCSVRVCVCVCIVSQYVY